MKSAPARVAARAWCSGPGPVIVALLLSAGCEAPNRSNRQIPAPSPTAASAGALSRAGALPAVALQKPPVDESRQVHLRAEGQLGPGRGVLLIDLAPPAGAKLTLDAPLSARGSGGIGLGFPSRLSGPLSAQTLPLRLPIEVADGATGPAQVELSYFWCTDGNEAACRREQARLNIDLDLSGSGAGGEAHLSYQPRGDKS
jgi:hypothetical protein